MVNRKGSHEVLTGVVMIDGILTNKELVLIVELLEAEHKRLLPEIHHTDSRLMRHDLVERARAVERIIERFKTIQEESKASVAAKP
jgi:hypothetical protein